MVKIECRQVGSVCVVDLTGQIDGGPESAELQSVVKNEMESDHKLFLINLSQVKWINSLGVGRLIAAFASAKRDGATLKFCGASERVATVLRTAGVIPNVFEIFAGEDEALGSFSS